MPALRTLVSVSHYFQPPNVHPKGQIIPHDLQRIELVTAGRGWIEHEKQSVEVVAGALLWQQPGDKTISRSDFQNPYRCLAVNFRVAPVSPRPVSRISQWLDLEAIHAFTAEVVRHFVNDAFPREVLCEFLYATLLYRAKLSALRTESQPMPDPLRRALNLIDSTFGSRLTLAALAKHVGWSAAHLSETCRIHLNQTLHQRLMARRLRAVREQLVGTDKPIKAIALDCGFSHAAACCEAFRNAFDMTPGSYRLKFQTGLALSQSRKT